MKKIYMLGIGGVSMSALAIMLKNQGYFVAGYDQTPSRATEMLGDKNIHVDFKPNFKMILDSDEVCYSSAISFSDKQFQFAQKNHKVMMSRGQLLGKISQEYEYVIAVAGSHGKTTTTAMIYQILKCAGENPTLHLGGFRIADGLNFDIGDKKFFVTEACEYCDNFLNLHPYISVVTNVEKEHMDYFKTFENQKRSFEKFKRQSKIVVDNEKNLRAKNIRHDKNGNLMFSLFENDKKIFNLHLKICEEINTQNCIYAYQVAKILKIPDCIIKLGLENYQGVSSRFEKVECPDFDIVIVDYAHHPTEISKAITTAKKIYKNREIVTIFQPHTYSRTKNLLPEFVKTFSALPLPIFYKTYPARERAADGISAKEFVKILKKHNKNAKYFENFEKLSAFLHKLQREKVVLLFIGAGDLPSILHKNHFI